MTQPREILEAALKLDPIERAAIASEILESLADSGYGQLSPAWEDELQRRLREVEAGRTELLPADRVFAEVEAEVQARRARWAPIRFSAAGPRPTSVAPPCGTRQRAPV